MMHKVKQKLSLPKIILNKAGKVLLTLSIWIYSGNIIAQTLPVSNQLMQDYIRIKQLESEIDSNASLFTKPISSSILNTLKANSDFAFIPKNLLKEDGFIEFKILPLAFNQQFNSKNQYGWNDGLMIPAKGYQNYVSAGFYMKAGPLSVQIQPEFIYAQNPEFLRGNDKIASDRYTNYVSLSNYSADLPNYYEKPDFTLFGFGQSSIRLNFKAFSVGISNENLWWGPGRKNSLLMSNTARGFKHFTLNTLRPIATPIGSFEGQIISGRLENSGSPNSKFYNPEWRYLSGMVFSYQPRWVPGLFVGLSRAFQIYHSDLSGIGDYIPLFQPFEKLKTNEDYINRDQVTSVFARLLIPKAQAEVYVEYGRNDHSVDIRDFSMEPDHSRAYIVGFQKLTNLGTRNEKLLLSAELTQLSQSPTRFVREAGSWYVHSINQGYTNRGEVIGAGIGPGGNIQTIDLSWINGIKKMGIQFERFVHNDEFYQILRAGSSSNNGRWVDLSAGILFNWDYKDFVINSKLLGVQSYNYLWQSGYYGTDRRNAFNIHANIGLSYYIK